MERTSPSTPEELVSCHACTLKSDPSAAEALFFLAGAAHRRRTETPDRFHPSLALPFPLASSLPPLSRPSNPSRRTHVLPSDFRLDATRATMQKPRTLPHAADDAEMLDFLFQPFHFGNLSPARTASAYFNDI